jgi:hypothetical protein
MNIDIFKHLKSIKNTLECEKEESLKAADDLRSKCLEALQLIDELRFRDNSPHIQLATRHAIQYLQKALAEIDAFTASYNSASRGRLGNFKDICAPAHAGLEIILNLNY